MKHPRDARGRFIRKGALPQTKAPWEHSTQRARASELRPGDFLSWQYEIARVEHGGKPHTVRVILKGGARITLRDDYRVNVRRASFGGESFFSENKTLHAGDPAIKDLVSAYKDRLHVAEDGAGWDTDAVQRHLRGLQDVPASHRRFLARSHVEVYVGTEPVTKQDSMGYLSAQHPPGYPTGDTYDQCSALFSWPVYDTTKKPEFGKTYNPPMTKPGRIVLGNRTGSGSVNTAAHETGHALDKFLGEDAFFRGAGDLSGTSEFTGIYDRFAGGVKDGKWLANPYYLQDADKPAQFGTFHRGKSEAFAEGYAAWVATGKRPSPHRAEEIMDALGVHPGIPEVSGQTLRQITAAKRQIGEDLIAFYDGLDARIKGATKRLPPPHMKAAAK